MSLGQNCLQLKTESSKMRMGSCHASFLSLTLNSLNCVIRLTKLTFSHLSHLFLTCTCALILYSSLTVFNSQLNSFILLSLYLLCFFLQCLFLFCSFFKISMSTYTSVSRSFCHIVVIIYFLLLFYYFLFLITVKAWNIEIMFHYSL